MTLLDLGKFDEARALALSMLEKNPARLPVDEGRGRWACAEVYLRQGELEAAERELPRALDLLQSIPVEHVPAMATLAAIKLAQGRAAEALATADEAMKGYERLHIFGFKGMFARLIHAGALHATGQHDKARQALATARDRLLAGATRIGDPALRQSFLQRVPENARILLLAREWHCPPPE
jgi:tetratricopeptide (TPR) repeat protein